jgi:hypothetical protein
MKEKQETVNTKLQSMKRYYNYIPVINLNQTASMV